jgi:hypothetical protein
MCANVEHQSWHLDGWTVRLVAQTVRPRRSGVAQMVYD